MKIQSNKINSKDNEVSDTESNISLKLQHNCLCPINNEYIINMNQNKTKHFEDLLQSYFNDGIQLLEKW